MGDPFPDNDRSSPPPQDNLPLDPELYDDDSTPPATPTPAQPTITPVSSAAPSASVSAASSYPPCSNAPQCKRLATAKGCSHRMCKTCCQLRATGCAYAPHRNSTPIVAANGNPSALARPPAIIPSASASSAASLPIDEFPDTLAPKTFRKSMNEAWAKQYQEGLAKQQQRREVEDEKRVELKRVQNEVAVCFFAEDDAPPERLRDQNVNSFPFFNLARSTTLLRKMSLQPDDHISIYDYQSRLWNTEDIDTTIQVIPGQTLIMRRVGVTRCMDIDRFIEVYAPPSRNKAKAANIKRKPDHERDASNRVVQVPRRHEEYVPKAPPSPARPRSLSSPPASPSVRSSSPFPSPRKLSASVFMSAAPQQPVIDLTGSPPPTPRRPRAQSLVVKTEAVSDTPSLAGPSSSSVTVLTDLGAWPAGVYARDIAPFSTKDLTQHVLLLISHPTRRGNLKHTAVSTTVSEPKNVARATITPQGRTIICWIRCPCWQFQFLHLLRSCFGIQRVVWIRNCRPRNLSAKLEHCFVSFLVIQSVAFFVIGAKAMSIALEGDWTV
ncbi:hypothetical protein R3P38DRAFT_3325334 [Favolaschia claudopus]|uniref:Uncharacterized protein n=1 Tax=Favolaschia claudopus TaxID=2862362 RepID=A0AAW0ADL6_9AGAR